MRSVSQEVDGATRIFLFCQWFVGGTFIYLCLCSWTLRLILPLLLGVHSDTMPKTIGSTMMLLLCTLQSMKASMKVKVLWRVFWLHRQRGVGRTAPLGLELLQAFPLSSECQWDYNETQHVINWIKFRGRNTAQQPCCYIDIGLAQKNQQSSAARSECSKAHFVSKTLILWARTSQ